MSWATSKFQPYTLVAPQRIYASASPARQVLDFQDWMCRNIYTVGKFAYFKLPTNAILVTFFLAAVLAPSGQIAYYIASFTPAHHVRLGFYAAILCCYVLMILYSAYPDPASAKWHQKPASFTLQSVLRAQDVRFASQNRVDWMRATSATLSSSVCFALADGLLAVTTYICIYI